ncbi:hypothetical protein [Microtetraspora fusca]|nr:hypothetical protein [Microtetraspora fusca]
MGSIDHAVAERSLTTGNAESPTGKGFRERAIVVSATGALFED